MEKKTRFKSADCSMPRVNNVVIHGLRRARDTIVLVHKILHSKFPLRNSHDTHTHTACTSSPGPHTHTQTLHGRPHQGQCA